MQVLCKLPEGAEHGELLVTDVMGRVMVSRPVAPQGAILELDMQSWANGTYLANLRVDGINVGSIKLSKLR